MALTVIPSPIGGPAPLGVPIRSDWFEIPSGATKLSCFVSGSQAAYLREDFRWGMTLELSPDRQAVRTPSGLQQGTGASDSIAPHAEGADPGTITEGFVNFSFVPESALAFNATLQASDKFARLAITPIEADGVSAMYLSGQLECYDADGNVIDFDPSRRFS